MNELQSRMRSRGRTDTELLVRESVRAASLKFLISEVGETSPADESGGGGEPTGTDVFADSSNDLLQKFVQFGKALKTKDPEGNEIFPETMKALSAVGGKLKSQLTNKKQATNAFTAISLFMGSSAVLFAKAAREVADFDGTVDEGIDGYDAFIEKSFRPTKKWWDYTKKVVESYTSALSEAYGYDSDLVLESNDPELLREFEFLKRLGRWVKGKFQKLFQGNEPPPTAATINSINEIFGSGFSETFHKELGAADSKTFIGVFNKVKAILSQVSVNTPAAPEVPAADTGAGAGESGAGGAGGGEGGSGGSGARVPTEQQITATSNAPSEVKTASKTAIDDYFGPEVAKALTDVMFKKRKLEDLPEPTKGIVGDYLARLAKDLKGGGEPDPERIAKQSMRTVLGIDQKKKDDIVGLVGEEGFDAFLKPIVSGEVKVSELGISVRESLSRKSLGFLFEAEDETPADFIEKIGAAIKDHIKDEDKKDKPDEIAKSIYKILKSKPPSSDKAARSKLKVIGKLPGDDRDEIEDMGGPKAPKFVDDVIDGSDDLKTALGVSESRSRGWVKFLFEEEGKSVPDKVIDALTAGEDKLGDGNDITSDEAEKIAKMVKSHFGEKKRVSGLEAELADVKKVKAELEASDDLKNGKKFKEVISSLKTSLGIDSDDEAIKLISDPESFRKKMKELGADSEDGKKLAQALEDVKRLTGQVAELGTQLEDAKKKAQEASDALATEKGKKFKDSPEYKEIVSKLQLALGSVDEKGVEELLQDENKLAEKIKELGSDPKKLEELTQAQTDLKAALEKVGALEAEVSKLKSELSTIGDVLKGENAELLKKNEQYKSIIDDLSKVFRLGPAEVQKLLTQKEEYEKALSELRGKNEEGAKKVEELTSQLAQTAEKLASAEKRVGELEAEVKTISDALKSKDAEALKSSKEYQDIIEDLGKLLKVNEEKLLKSLTEKGEYDKLISDLRKSNEEGAKKAEELTSELAKVAEKLASTEGELKAAKEASEKLKGEIENLKKNKQELLDALKKSEDEKTDAEVKFENSLRDLSAELINLEIDKNDEIADIISLAKKVYNSADAKGEMTSDELIRFLELVGDPLKVDKIVAAAEPGTAEKIKSVADSATAVNATEKKSGIADSRRRRGISLVEAMFDEVNTLRLRAPADGNVYSVESERKKVADSKEDDTIIERWQRLAGLIR